MKSKASQRRRPFLRLKVEVMYEALLIAGSARASQTASVSLAKGHFLPLFSRLLPGGFVADSSFVCLFCTCWEGVYVRVCTVYVYMHAENNLRCCASGTTCIF